MNVSEAKSQIFNLLKSALGVDEFNSIISPDVLNSKDPGKFSLLGKSARVIHRFNGWNTPINLD